MQQMKTTILKLSIFFIIIIFTSCNNNDTITGSGNLIEKQLTISTFDKIEIISSVNVNIRSSGNGKSEVSCNDNLNIRISGSLNVFYKGHPNLTVSSSGSGNVTSAN